MNWQEPDCAVDDAWTLLTAAAEQTDHACRVVALATISAEGPRVRSVVLRQATRVRRSLTVYADVRSEKVVQITQAPMAELMAYEPTVRLQVRARGRLRVTRQGPRWRQAWEQLSERQRGEYLRITDAGADRSAEPTGRARRNFALLQLEAKFLDLLLIGRSGHKRVQAQWGRRGWIAQWAVP